MIDQSTIVLLSRSSTGLSLRALLSSPLRSLHLPESTTGHSLLLVQSMGELLGGLLDVSWGLFSRNGAILRVVYDYFMPDSFSRLLLQRSHQVVASMAFLQT